ncbi:hypothetical protein GOBAR_AA28506 [Gossypium barbadense]|uniref:Uncharacterized protein n=1 Tax=Gossypium barbadense TaxID=3634 RepID=A0A2P5WM56_GOSBA|nr:hypothetical protein GOBAR_AA28506 [Gossypium barbadense]
MEEEHAQSISPSTLASRRNKSNKWLNAINVQDEEGFAEPEPEPREETVVSRGQGELTLRVGDETITFQARNSSNTSEIEGDRLNHSTKTDNMVHPTLQEISLKEVHEPFLSNSRGPIHEDQKLQIEELNEWRAHKSRTHDKPKLRQNELNTFPNQLKVGDKILLDAVDPHIVTTKPNEEIPFTILSIFHSLADAIRAFLTTEPWELFFGIIEPTYLEPKVELCSTFHFQTVMTNFDDPGTDALVPGSTTYNPSRSKASALPPSLRYLHAILAHMITRRRESTGVVNTDDPIFYGGVISICPYVTRLARHFGFLRTAAQESSLTLIGQMSPQGISSMLSMRMIEKRRGTYPPQYRLTQSIEEEAPEDITNDVPPQHEDPPSQPPPLSLLVHAAISYADIYERLT